jgi:hypothetical protein
MLIICQIPTKPGSHLKAQLKVNKPPPPSQLSDSMALLHIALIGSFNVHFPQRYQFPPSFHHS